MAKEFLPDVPQESPIPVSVREAKVYLIDVGEWLNPGDTPAAENFTARLTDRYGGEVTDGAAVQDYTGTSVSLLADWTKAVLAQEYFLWVVMSLGGRKEEGFLRFRTLAI